ncbi:hypothetical protein B0H12DRAFT_1132342 [Mycena haematopus]|nr:hypothetical protein B0H12DRAFT_1132342 [Mycena haematopus]
MDLVRERMTLGVSLRPMLRANDARRSIHNERDDLDSETGVSAELKVRGKLERITMINSLST